MSAAAKASRFSVLNVETVVDSSSDDENGKHSSDKAANQFISAQGIKKKNKKKKQAEDARKKINEMVNVLIIVHRSYQVLPGFSRIHP